MLIGGFLLCALFLILQSVLPFPMTFLPFAPWIAFVILRCSLPQTLWLTTASGALLDLLSDDPMGVHALNHCLTATLLYRFRNHFLHDNPLHLSLFSTSVSFVYTILQWILFFFFEKKVPFGKISVLTDFFAMPLIDGLYAFFWFALPLMLLHKLRRYALQSKLSQQREG